MGNSGNANLQRAAKAKEDEFYTQLVDIEHELRHYKRHFKGKSVLCNCDDPYESNFFKYFAMNFNTLGLKKLVTTCYKESPIVGTQLSLFDFDNEPTSRPFKLEINEVKDFNNDGAVNIYDVEWLIQNDANVMTPLDGDGDFRSEECQRLLEEADIVVTNPPFSLFKEFLASLVEKQKSFLIIGSQNAITYKDTFNLFKENKVWMGYKAGDMKFTVPDYYEPRATRYWQDESGQKWRSLGNICWYTNLDHSKRHEGITLFKSYNPKEYPTYHNVEAIEVSKVAEIPCDYVGVMGVPITFLDKYSPDQFEILGLDYDEIPTKVGLDEKFVNDYYAQGNTGSISVGHPSLGYYLPDGKVVRTYRRVFIRNKHPEVDE